MRIQFVAFASTLLFAACAQGPIDATPTDDASTPIEGDDAGVRDGMSLDAPVFVDSTAPSPDATGDDSVPTGDDASSGDDAPSTQDAPSGQDAESTADASDSSTPPPVDAGADTGSVAAQKPAQGEILITEVMFNPSGAEPGTEWFEVTNVASTARDLGGLTMTDGAATPHNETISGSLVVQPGAYVVLGNAAIGSSVPASAVVYKYSTLTLVNTTAGAISLANGAKTIAQSPYGPWNDSVNGKSIQLKTLTFADESTAGSWCLSSTAWSGSTDDGTPGAASDCP